MALIGARGEVVGKGALKARVWRDRIVGENALHSQISALRAAFGAERELIRTVSGRGYQFTGEARGLTPAHKIDHDTGENRIDAARLAVYAHALLEVVPAAVETGGDPALYSLAA